MIQSVLNLFVPMLLGTQLILFSVLYKGQICPGQRGRIHRLIPGIGLLWLSVVSTQLYAFLVAACLFHFYSRVTKGKTKDKGPLWSLALASILAFGLLVMQLLAWHNITVGYLPD